MARTIIEQLVVVVCSFALGWFVHEWITHNTRERVVLMVDKNGKLRGLMASHDCKVDTMEYVEGNGNEEEKDG